jgi:hypothetical protein
LKKHSRGCGRVIQRTGTENKLVQRWAELFLLSLYAAFVVSRMKDPVGVAYWRKLTRTIFSGGFFVQLIGGLFGAERLLMTGELHFPVPALIILGPLYLVISVSLHAAFLGLARV